MSGFRLLTVAGILVLALFGGAGSAEAAAPEQPLLEATGRTPTGLSFRGVLYPNAIGEPGSYELLYNQSATQCEGGGKTLAGLASGNQGEEVFEAISGLETGKQYTVCLRVSNGSEATLSQAVTVRTAIPPETPIEEQAGEVHPTEATLEGTLNAAAPGEAGSYEFIYRQGASGCEGEGAQAAFGASAGAQGERVTAPVGGLLPGTAYSFCLSAFNQIGESATGASVTFTTPPAAPKIEEAGPLTVEQTAATLSAKINPQGAETQYRFEYAPAGGAFAPVAEPGGAGSVPAGTAGVAVQTSVQGLSPHSEYEFRVVAENVVETVSGEAVPFRTQQPSAQFSLPDGRQWEMVSPPNKEGAQIEPLQNSEGGLIQAAEDGHAIAYLANAPVGSDQQSSPSPNYTQLLAKRGVSGGWSTKDIATVQDHPDGVAPGHSSEYVAFSPDLSRALTDPQITQEEPTPLPPLPPDAEGTPYIREADGSYVPLVTSADVTSGEKFGKQLESEGVSSDLSHVIVRSEVPLLAGQSALAYLYDWGIGGLRPVGVLPDHELAAVPILAGRRSTSARNAVSVDGSHVYWSQSVEHLYLSDEENEETVQLDVAEQGIHNRCEENNTCGEPGFQLANADGSEALFTSAMRLTSSSAEAATDLYIFEVSGEKPLLGKLTDLTPDNGEPANVVGEAIGAGEDSKTGQLSAVYFVATGALANNENGAHERAVVGANNLYVAKRSGSTWQTDFIARLAEGDRHDWASLEGLGDMTARVSPDGQFLAFMSERSLTGYDNHDVRSGEADEEVFLYRAATNSLICASCNPTGARPAGVLDPEVFGTEKLLVDTPVRVWGGRWLAGSVPGWQDWSLGASRYQSRYLLDDGRMFFDSPDALAPLASNGLENVYEYEPAGMGSCEESSATFSPSSEGCVDLISSGTSAGESAFLDASQSGDDVFFLTAGQLVNADQDHAYDLYDAHACSIAAPCTSGEVAVPPACTTTDSCRVAPSVQPTIFGPPASATFLGAGNPTRAGGVPKHKAKKPRTKAKHKKKRKRPRRARKGSRRHSKGGRR